MMIMRWRMMIIRGERGGVRGTRGAGKDSEGSYDNYTEEDRHEGVGQATMIRGKKGAKGVVGE
jgi:hypothetical protein